MWPSSDAQTATAYIMLKDATVAADFAKQEQDYD
jgi:hypothetical protein